MANSSGRGQAMRDAFIPPRLSGRGYAGTPEAQRPVSVARPQGRAALSVADQLALARAPRLASGGRQASGPLPAPVLRGPIPGPYETRPDAIEMVGDARLEHPLGMSPPLGGLYQLNPPRPIVHQGDGAFGTYRRKADGSAGWHHGVDITAPVGTPVYSTEDGRVIRADGRDKRGYGQQVEVQGPGGRAERYGHLSQFGVKLGERVSQGQLIGYTGVSGNPPKAGAPHLHFEVLEHGDAVNPDAYFDRKGLARGQPLNPYLQELIYGPG